MLCNYQDDHKHNSTKISYNLNLNKLEKPYLDSYMNKFHQNLSSSMREVENLFNEESSKL